MPIFRQRRFFARRLPSAHHRHRSLHLDFSIAFFIGNAFSVMLISDLVPWTAKHLGW